MSSEVDSKMEIQSMMRPDCNRSNLEKINLKIEKKVKFMKMSFPTSTAIYDQFEIQTDSERLEAKLLIWN